MLKLILLISCIVAALAIFPEDIAKGDNQAWLDLEQRVELGVAASGDAMIWSSMEQRIDGITEQLNSWKAGNRASPEGITNIGVPGATPLSGMCLNLNCDYFYYFLTCKEFGVNMDHICASYFVGWIFHCSDYPYYETISDAPSVCLGQFATDALPVISNAAANFGNISSIHNYTAACERNCYQNFVRTGSKFINECYADLLAAPVPTYNLSALYVFNAFYGLNCAQSVDDYKLAARGNCYDQLQASLHTSVPYPGFILPTENYYCNDPTLNMIYCQFAFEPSGCCFANQFMIAQQTPTGNQPENITILPPCVQRYNYMNCPNVSLSGSMCTHGANQNSTIIQGYIEIKTKPSGLSKLGPYFPDVYDHVSMVNFQGVISTAISKNPAAAGQIILPSINVQITNYSYYNLTGSSLTPDTGSGISPDQSDYKDAKSAKFWFNVAMVYSTESQAAINNAFLGTSEFKQIVGAAYGLPSAEIDAYATTSVPYFYQAEPFNTAHTSSAVACVRAGSSLSLLVGTMLMCLLVLGMW